MKILILSCNTGGGHNAAGHAVLEAARLRGHDALLQDMMLLSSERTSRLVGGAYINIARTLPHLFGFIYKLGSLISNRYVKSPVYWANARLAKKLAAYIDANHFDIVVTPHLYPAETLTYMKRHNMLHIKTVAVGTDYTCIPFWEETDCDYYVIPHEDLTEEFVKRGVPREKLLPYGIPVAQSFTRPTDKTAARRKCNLPLDKPLYLIMSGSMGFGKLAVFSLALSKHCKSGEHIIIICGSNKKIRRILNHQFHGNKQVHILGYTTHVSLYMDACDVIFTKPGGLTSTEALVKNIPIVHTAPIPGCETKNSAFFAKRGLSFASKYMIEQIRLGQMLIRDAKLSGEMSKDQQANRKPDAAMRIIDLLEKTVKQKQL